MKIIKTLKINYFRFSFTKMNCDFMHWGTWMLCKQHYLFPRKLIIVRLCSRKLKNIATSVFVFCGLRLKHIAVNGASVLIENIYMSWPQLKCLHVNIVGVLVYKRSLEPLIQKYVATYIFITCNNSVCHVYVIPCHIIKLLAS